MIVAMVLAMAAVNPAAPPRVVSPAAANRLKPPATVRVAPVPAAAKLAVLRKGGIVVRDLPVGPPRVTVAAPVNKDLSLSFYGIFAADAGLDFAQMRDRQGFIGLNWIGDPSRVYLVDCELPGSNAATVVEVAVDGAAWTPAAVSGGHLLYAVPPVPDYPGYTGRAFAMRSTGTGFHGCEVSQVK
ncbi:MAG: hypothetical protein JO290_03195 [Sphingomonadaceae bacterium]|nr:hypothetical protein [Sphingomonadaceae bacterium]